MADDGNIAISTVPKGASGLQNYLSFYVVLAVSCKCNFSDA